MQVWSGGALVAQEVEVADTFMKRLAGLMGKRLRAEQGLLLKACHAVHTSFMREAIDIVFLDAGLRVLDIGHEVGPWRTRTCRGAEMTLEVARGRCRSAGVQPGDVLQFRD